MDTDPDRARILEAASNRFLEAGISKVTLDEIASELRMSKKTLYKYFPSKDSLLKHVIQERIKRNGKRFNDIMVSKKPFEEKLQDILFFAGKEITTPGRQFILDLRRIAPDLWEQAEEFRRGTIVAAVTKMMRQAKEEGVLRKDLDVELFVLMFQGSVQEILNPRTLSEQPFTAVQAFSGILKILFEGALTAKARLRRSDDIPNELSIER
ncbi:MAG TPA: TetR/AcrR family transcriptional regulator [Bacteroidota bacterium]|nr:TetR/AcrR family transcriptional regulator [Bacteroidota bacterium]